MLTTFLQKLGEQFNCETSIQTILTLETLMYSIILYITMILIFFTSLFCMHTFTYQFCIQQCDMFLLLFNCVCNCVRKLLSVMKGLCGRLIPLYTSNTAVVSVKCQHQYNADCLPLCSTMALLCQCQRHDKVFRVGTIGKAQLDCFGLSLCFVENIKQQRLTYFPPTTSLFIGIYHVLISQL